jgi:hypothetical protein
VDKFFSIKTIAYILKYKKITPCCKRMNNNCSHSVIFNFLGKNKMDLFKIWPELSKCKYIQPDSCIKNQATTIQMDNQTRQEYYVKIVLELDEQEKNTLKSAGQLINESIEIHGHNKKEFLDNNNGTVEIYAYRLSNSIREPGTIGGRLQAHPSSYGFYYPSKSLSTVDNQL